MGDLNSGLLSSRVNFPVIFICSFESTLLMQTLVERAHGSVTWSVLVGSIQRVSGEALLIAGG